MASLPLEIPGGTDIGEENPKENSAVTRLKVSARDLEALRKFGITVDLLIEARVQRVTDRQAREDFGIVASQTSDMSGIIFPYFSLVNGYRVTARLRRDNPEIEDGKEKNKYISAWGDSKHLYFPPGSTLKFEEPGIPVALVESEKAALALAAWAERTGMNILPVGLGGCWGWRGRIGKVENPRGHRVDKVGPLPDLHCCDGRTVFLMLDANIATNPKVRQAQTALATELRNRKCAVLFCSLPVIDGVNGPDDYISVCGDKALGEVFARAHEDTDRPAEFSDDALALNFTDLHGDSLRYTAPWGRWSRWDGVRWRKDESLHVFDLARGVCRTAAAKVEKPQVASRIASAQTVAAVERLARADRRHAASVDQWDADPWLLNTPSGIVDLRTGIVRVARPQDYMTKSTAVVPEGASPLWLIFLERITDGNVELQQFIQRMCGYTLTGTTREHALFFLYGAGGNGKSVFLNVISFVMGDYARAAPIETFIASASEHHPTDLAGLQGARLVTATETEDGRSWAESKLKALTGGDQIAARFMRQDYFEYLPQFKLIVAGNHKPGLRTVDEAMRRRFHLLPFTATIPPSERDLDLTEKLKQEGSGVLQWMIHGCVAWQTRGLSPPTVVTDATSSYFAAEDTLARWMEDRCDVSKSHWTPTAVLFQSWRRWCGLNEESPGSQRRFSESLESRGFTPKRSNAARGFMGLGIVTHVTDAPDSCVTRERAGERSISAKLSHASRSSD